ncbi:MAG: hypothetical protein MK101_07625 [Phycisphaerales bacterium]|nr:hypothetical protein [Phycisphaerales bacterium]
MTSQFRTAMTRLTSLVLLAAIASCGLVAVVWFLEGTDAKTSSTPQGPEIAPPSATEAPPVEDLGDPNLNVELAQGGWVQIAGDDGALAQQYRFDHLDPDPESLGDHWLRMQQPQVQLFMTGGRLVTLTGQTLEAYAPKRALERGTLEGQVVIRLYEQPESGSLDIATTTPAMTVRTGKASFDNLAGRIECPGEITAVSATERMSGADLLVLLNDRDDRIEFLRLARVDWIMLRERSLQRAGHAPARRHVEFASRRFASVTSANQAQRPSGPSGDADAQFYRLRMTEQIRIEQEDQAGRRLAVGDTLDLVFSMSGQSALSNPEPPAAAVAAGPLPWALSALVIGSQDAPLPRPGEIVVTCDGPLTMVPLPEGTQRPTDAAASRLELTGSPVRLLDTSDRIGGVCDRLEYRSSTQRVDLRSDSGGDVTLVTDDVWLRSKDRLWVEMDTGLAGSGPTAGSALMMASSPLSAALIDEDAAMIDPNAPDQIEQDLSIEWTDGVSVRFEPGGASGAGQMKLVQFNGDVQVRSPDGEIDADLLEMRFVPDADGKARPERFIARGSIRAHNEDQTLWADTLVATLEAAEQPDQAASEETAEASDDLMANARVRDFDAQGNVQVLLADGARAFADTLVGDARQERVVLKGENIVVARADLLIEHGTEVTIERRDGRATWPGGGLARLLSRSIDVTQNHRISRPDVPAPTPKVPRVVSMRATWNESLTYDGAFADGAGALDLLGDVQVVSQPKPTERSSLGGASLRLEFASITDGAEATGSDRDAQVNTDLFGGEGRVLSTLLATGKARLERRRWETDARRSTPEIVYIGGDRVLWDDLNTRAQVRGEGDFVTRRPAWATTQGDGPFRGPGTARFTWANELNMVRRDDERHDIVMRGMVEGQWKGATEPTDIATLAADAVTAVTARASNADEASPATAISDSLDFNSQATIERVTAKGRVFLATPMRRADADALVYSTRTGIARLEGTHAHPVAILTEGAPLPVRAVAMTWNMDPAIDTITLESPRGSGSR